MIREISLLNAYFYQRRHICKLGVVESSTSKGNRKQSINYHVRHTLITNLPTNDKFTMRQPILCGVSVVETPMPPKQTIGMCSSHFNILYKVLTQTQHEHPFLSIKTVTSRHLQTDYFKNRQGMDHDTELNHLIRST
ncbi:hypothetical protein DPMN_107821 [Dreissena polymorpha]|uniref:Uncharacterized protein n=1 Tax=Dreissena polymorpha TaxID=45954 RepID=A0A9D4QK90_DREPO|nr:hypothetical protein DPMN_107821 [Dreissena polymorpha]